MSTKKSVKKKSEMEIVEESSINADEIPFKIPDNWKWVRLSTVGIWKSGLTPSRSKAEYYGEGYPWLKIGDLNDSYIYESEESITKLAIENTSIKIFPPETVIIAMYGSIGKLGILKIHAATNQACCACIVSDNVFNKYLFYFLMFNKQYFIIKSFGGVQSNISKEKIEATLMPLTNLEEQKLIAAKIESEFQKIDEALTKLNIIKEQIKQYKQSVLKYAFDENNSFAKGSNYEPYEWEEKILNDVCYINPTTIIPEDFNDDTEVSFLPMTNVEADTNKYIESIEKYQKVKKGYTKFQENDILFAKITPCMENGKICVINKLKSKIGFGSTEFHVIRNKENVFIDFIYYFLSSEEFRMNAKQKMTGAVGQKRVQASYLINHTIKLPNIELQKNIADNIQNIFEKMDNIQNNINQNIDKLNILKQAILKKAFEGKLI